MGSLKNNVITQPSLVQPDTNSPLDLLSLSGDNVINNIQSSIIYVLNKPTAAGSNAILPMHETCHLFNQMKRLSSFTIC